MTTEYDVIVLGVGGMGSATLDHVARRGLDVLGIERYDVPHAKGSSHGVTRIIRMQQYKDPVYVPLVRRALDRWQDLDDWYGETLLRQVGSVDVGPPESELLVGSKRSCAVHGIDHEVLSGRALHERFPGYDLPDDYEAVLQADGGFLHAEQCTVAHVERAHAHGATVRARERVTDWRTSASGVRVTTDRGEYAAETLVVTAGAWTGQLLPSLDPLLQPERQVLGWFQPAAPRHFEPERFPVFVAEVPDGHYYGFPVYHVPGFKLGKFHHFEETGSPEELAAEPTRADEEALREFAAEYLSEGAGPTMRLSTCMFTNTPDEDFLLDVHPDHENVVVGAGFSGHGFKFAPVVGEILADLAVDGATELDVEPFRIGRFE